jgi:hypothetical protein
MAHKKASSPTVISAFGGAALGLVLLIIGTALKSHFQTTAALCNTFEGATSHCVANGSAYTVGQVLQAFGGIMLVVGLLGGIVLLVSGNSSTKPATPAQPRVATPRPQPSNNPTQTIIETNKTTPQPPARPQSPSPSTEQGDW